MHVLILFFCEEDYLRLHSRMVWYPGQVSMHIFKWTSDFNVKKKALWFQFGSLFSPHYPFFCTANHVQDCIPSWHAPALDAATTQLKRPGVARLQVEIDELKNRPH